MFRRDTDAELNELSSSLVLHTWVAGKRLTARNGSDSLRRFEVGPKACDGPEAGNARRTARSPTIS